MTKFVTLSKRIPDDPNFSFWTYEDGYITNKATAEVLTQTDKGLRIMPKITVSKDASQQWTLDFNGEDHFLNRTKYKVAPTVRLGGDTL